MLNEEILIAFRDQLKKEAAAQILPQHISNILMSGGALGGIGLGAGGLIGGARGAIKGYREAKQQGATTGEAIRASLGRGAVGAGKGALIGGAAGLGAGAVGTLLSPEKAEQARKLLTEKSRLARFGQRQVHGFTSALPTGGLSELRHGSSVGERAKNLEGLQAQIIHGYATNNPKSFKPGIIDKALGRTQNDVIAREIKSHKAALETAKALEEGGLTSIPGIAKGLVTRPLHTLATTAREQIAGQSLPMKALTVGLPAYQLGKQVLRKDEGVDQFGDTKAQGIGKAIAGTLAGTVLGPVPLAANMLAQSPISRAGRGVGTLVDKATHHEVSPEALPTYYTTKPHRSRPYKHRYTI